MSGPTPEPDDRRQAVDALVREHGGTLFRLGLRLCRTPQDAEEMVQETFLNAYRGWDDFEGRSRPKTWLYTIARRACQRLQRRRAGEPDRMEPLGELLPGPEDAVLDVDAIDPGREQLRREAEAVVDEALGTLPPEFRLALVLVDIAELSIGETAEVLGVPPNTVKTRVHRARLKLRAAIEDRLPRTRVPAAGPGHVCLSLLQAKLEALDNDTVFPVSDAALCGRCRAVFASLDLEREACRSLGRGELPDPVATRLASTLSTLAEAG